MDPATRRWLEDDATFFRELRSGHGQAERVGDRFCAAGLAVEVTPMAIRASVDTRDEFHDEADILIWLAIDRYMIVEVKSRRLHFTDDPCSYPYRTAFVDAVETWDGKTRPRVAHVLVSQSCGGMLVVPYTSRQFWWRERRYDRIRRIDRNFYMMHARHLVTFASLVAYLQRCSE